VSRITLNELVRNQILEEGPEIGRTSRREEYIDQQLNNMSQTELLERISDALLEQISDAQLLPVVLASCEQ
jgi:hypothetical protein